MAHSDNHAARRLEEKRQGIIETNPNPPRSEVVDMMLAEALDREDELAAAKAEKAGGRGLRSAQRRPAKVERPAVKPPLPASSMSDEDAQFFENLLAPAPPTDSNLPEESKSNDD